MGGKSTLLRACGIAVVLAHAGACVPASSMRLSPCDAVMTRMGAGDALASGHSSFLNEMAETEQILRCLTADSMILMDELGRGTSTIDGYAIASAVLAALAASHARAFFATHFRSLTTQFAANTAVWSAHMAARLRDIDGDAAGEEDIVFLYKLEAGAALRSYGAHVASLAGVPRALVRDAAAKAAALEATLGVAFEGASEEGGLRPEEVAALQSAVEAVQPWAPLSALLGARAAAQAALDK